MTLVFPKLFFPLARTAMSLVCTLAYCYAASDQSLAVFRSIDGLITQISVHAHLALRGSHAVGPQGADSADDAARDYTKERIAVDLGRWEEWEAPLGDARYLLEEPRRGQLISRLGEVTTSSAESLSVTDRVLLQNLLWATFDQVYFVMERDLVESKPVASHLALLKSLAIVIYRIALSESEMKAAEPSPNFLEKIWNAQELARSLELRCVEEPSQHEGASRFRSFTRIVISDPLADLTKVDTLRLSRLMAGQDALAVGARAYLEEDALVIGRDFTLNRTGVPLIARTYAIDRPGSGFGLRFSAFKSLRLGGAGDPSSLQPFPADAKGWSKIDLPNVPGDENTVFYRSPLLVTCAECHHGTTMVFNPSLRKHNAAFMDYKAYDGTPLESGIEQTVAQKRRTSEFLALSRMMARAAEEK